MYFGTRGTGALIALCIVGGIGIGASLPRSETVRSQSSETRTVPVYQNVTQAGRSQAGEAGASQPQVEPAQARPEAVSHTVRQGDNLWRVIESTLGLSESGRIVAAIDNVVGANVDRYPSLALDNRAVVGGAVVATGDGIPGDLILPGQEIVLSRAGPAAGASGPQPAAAIPAAPIPAASSQRQVEAGTTDIPVSITRSETVRKAPPNLEGALLGGIIGTGAAMALFVAAAFERGRAAPALRT